MNKTTVFAAVLDRLRDDLAARRGAAESARAEATSDQSRSENKYDTRGLEASYLARGHALSTAELEADLAALGAFALPVAAPGARAELGTLVETSIAGSADWYFLLPCGGGREVDCGGARITVVTPASPMGGKLMGLRAGSMFPLRPGVPPGVVRNLF